MILVLLVLVFFSVPVFSPAQAETSDPIADQIIITGKDIEKMNVVKIKDLLNQIPGVSAGDSSVSVRGSSKVKVLLDGRAINDPTSSYGGVRWDMVSLKNIEKIEIYKGKGGVEFGDDSGGGVILITTKKIESFEGNIEAYLGNLETQNYSLNCRENKGNFGIGVSSAYESADGFRTNNDKKKFRASAKIQYKPEKDIHFSFSGDYLKEEKGLAGLPEFPSPHSRKNQNMASYLFLAKFREIKSRTYFNDTDTQNQDPDRNLDAFIQIKKFGEAFVTDISMGKWGKLNCGAGAEWARATGNRFDAQEETQFWGFASKNISLKSVPLSFTFGVRMNAYSEFEDVFNPEFKASFKQDVFSLQFAASKTNNMPSFRQRYNETSSMMPNPNLTMEHADNYSLSFFAQMNAVFSGGVSLFYNRLTDRITYVRGDDGRGQYENFGKVTYKGGEISLNWKLTDMLSLRSAYTYLEAKDENTGKWLPVKPGHRLNTDLICTPIKTLSLILATNYTSRAYTRTDNSQSVPEYFIGDLRAEYNFNTMSFFCEIGNIWDKSYFCADGYPSPPRTWLAGVNYQF
ncbi:Putative Vitamin B12 transporter, BtuB-like [Desulfonema magnum]|uniref:Vitamin B12 transporter, BtuB-like n=2 Tax=Desulfonema magnum TaxID=45655 RepID=A0A975GSG9_9BACT|nr:Putative Vitamin B12 transporter, BtuB-like [Desulfonema magnum]